MSKTSPASPDPRPAKPPRFSTGRGVGRGLVACLWLWTSAGPLAFAATNNQTPEPAPSPYAQALASFQRRSYDRALGQLERLPDSLSAGQRADALNLRGAIYLRQGRYEEARQAFAEAARVDPGLWAAKYNEAEVSFRQKRYAASRTEFDALRDRTSRVFHPEEHRFVDYKARLADLCAGHEQPALDFIAEHRAEAEPPVAWYYLNAALEQRRSRPQKAEQWLAQAEAKRPGVGGNAYAESFKRLGWPGEGEATPGQAALASSHRANRRASENLALAAAGERSSSKPTTEQQGAVSPESSSAQTTEPATVAVVQLMPNREAVAIPGDPPAAPPVESTPAFRYNSPPAPTDRLSVTDLPPTVPGWLNSTDVAAGGSAHREFVPGLLAKPRRGRGTPTPAPTPSPAPSAAPAPSAPPPSGGGAAASPAASPDASPAVSPAPEPTVSPAAPAGDDYLQKYEAAYAKFLEKDYPGTLSLLDEAEAVQPKQPQTATLRGLVFKQDYEAAYLAYRKADFTSALALLDQADQAQPNYPDALNLRGLVYSKQRVYDRAETMFKKAMAADPTLWAAKFNYAELPFNRGDYTTARSRFEDLLAETDAAKRPREAELTQYKVFLTLLLEGKTDQARSFMEHFNFSGATPAKYFCNAAMNFRAGTVDKANGWIDSARKEYSPALVSIFLEPFYRLGWLADPTGPAGTAFAAASPGVETASTPAAVPAVTATPKPPTVAAAATPTPAPVASATPAVAITAPAASASPKPPTVVAVMPANPPMVTASPALLALASPTPASPGPGLSLQAGVSPVATPNLVTAATPVPTLKPTPTLAPATPTLSATAKPTAAPTATPALVAAVSVTPAPTPRVTPAPTAPVAATASATAEAAETPGEPAAAKNLTSDDLLRLGIAAAVLLYGVYTVYRLLTVTSRRKARRLRTDSAVAKSEEVETPR